MQKIPVAIKQGFFEKTILLIENYYSFKFTTSSFLASTGYP